MTNTNTRPSRDAWHNLEARAVIEAEATSPDGLSTEEAVRRLAEHGPNALPAAKPRSLLQRIVAQIDNVLIYVLLGSAVITALLGHATDTAVIIGVVVLNALIGMVQEGRAEAALDAIRGMISPHSHVRRDARRVEIDAASVVPGDILIIEAGDRVTADIRLISARNLQIDEAVLTGESVPVRKAPAPVAIDAALGDRHCMAYSGTLVTSGQGTGVVVATGSATELGGISALIARVEQLETPLVAQMNVFAKQLTFYILALCVATLVFAVLVRSYPIADAFMAVVGMAVAAIPEGLPAVMTITLAIGVKRMAARQAIIRRLPAVETLGAVSTICSDKTGTLTRNEMTVTRIVTRSGSYDVEGVGYAPEGRVTGGTASAGGNATPDGELDRIAEIASLCNDASLRKQDNGWIVVGDPMEGALLTLAGKITGNDADLPARLPRIDAIPFDAEHRYMATLHVMGDGATVALVKGAPERIIEMCQPDAQGGAADDSAAFWHAAVVAMARNGQRVLALADATFAEPVRDLEPRHLDGKLRLCGLVGLIDPPRPEAIAAVRECQSAGITVKMITGDHAETATAIAAGLGLTDPSRVLTGNDLDRLDGAGFAAAVDRTNVFARTSPEHKLKLVESMQAEGAVVAMTGDGVNDAPALKRARVGVAMGKNGSEAAKEASDMVLADDNFASIVAAVREGRTVYDNLTKVIGWTMPTSCGETAIVAAAILFGLTLPITPVQILWINMVTAVGLGLVLAFEPSEHGVMDRPPREVSRPLLSGFLWWRVTLVSALFAIGAFAMFGWALERGLPIAEARTLVVNTVVVMEIFYLFSIRYLHGASLTWQGVLGTPAVLIGVGGIVILQIAFTYVPWMQSLFGTAAISLRDGAAAVASGVVLLVVLEAEKYVRRALA